MRAVTVWVLSSLLICWWVFIPPVYDELVKEGDYNWSEEDPRKLKALLSSPQVVHELPERGWEVLFSSGAGQHNIVGIGAVFVGAQKRQHDVVGDVDQKDYHGEPVRCVLVYLTRRERQVILMLYYMSVILFKLKNKQLGDVVVNIRQKQQAWHTVKEPSEVRNILEQGGRNWQDAGCDDDLNHHQRLWDFIDVMGQVNDGFLVDRSQNHQRQEN